MMLDESNSNDMMQNSIDEVHSGPDEIDVTTRYDIFWICNSMAVLVFVVILVWCFFSKHGERFVSSWTQARANGNLSDFWYNAGLILRREQEEERKLEPPERRRKRLIESFDRNNVKMIVKEDDMVETAEEREGDTQDFVTIDVSMSSDDISDSGGDSIVSSISSTLLQIPAFGDLAGRTVPNCCAVCLCSYEVGDTVIGSSNAECQHAFHEECILQWLVKTRKGTPCPCCRQDFTDLPNFNEGNDEPARPTGPQDGRDNDESPRADSDDQYGSVTDTSASQTVDVETL